MMCFISQLSIGPSVLFTGKSPVVGLAGANSVVAVPVGVAILRTINLLAFAKLAQHWTLYLARVVAVSDVDHLVVRNAGHCVLIHIQVDHHSQLVVPVHAFELVTPLTVGQIVEVNT